MEQIMDSNREQRAITVGVELDRSEDFAYSMEELSNLAEACDVKTVGKLTQKASRVHASHYIGSGKIEELRAMRDELEANVVIFNDELSPSQIRNLESSLECKVIDRTILILEIFAERARTKEAQLQVELARLQYMLPRLIGLRESLGRQSGGVGTKNRGAGEKQLELDRRRIEEKIAALHKELATIAAGRQIRRKQRHKNNIPVVGLVGYTNAGKSSLMNALIGTFDPDSHKQVLAKDMLFATLETSVRSIRLPDNKSFLLADTVGFVRSLPHHLVQAFRSTLEEVAEADLLVHVVDCANPQYEQMITVTNDTLRELGADRVPVVYVFNKADLLGREEDWPANEHDRVYLSAKTNVGIDELIRRIRDRIFDDYVRCDMLIPFDQGQVASYFNEAAHVLSTSYEENGTMLALECKRADYEKYRQYVVPQ